MLKKIEIAVCTFNRASERIPPPLTVGLVVQLLSHQKRHPVVVNSILTSAALFIIEGGIDGYMTAKKIKKIPKTRLFFRALANASNAFCFMLTVFNKSKQEDLPVFIAFSSAFGLSRFIFTFFEKKMNKNLDNPQHCARSMYRINCVLDWGTGTVMLLSTLNTLIPKSVFDHNWWLYSILGSASALVASTPVFSASMGVEGVPLTIINMIWTSISSGASLLWLSRYISENAEALAFPEHTAIILFSTLFLLMTMLTCFSKQEETIEADRDYDFGSDTTSDLNLISDKDTYININDNESTWLQKKNNSRTKNSFSFFCSKKNQEAPKKPPIYGKYDFSS